MNMQFDGEVALVSVVGLTRAAAIEYATQGIRINAVAPAVIRTDMTEQPSRTTISSRATRLPVGSSQNEGTLAARIVGLLFSSSSLPRLRWPTNPSGRRWET
jgi:NAD(P)-dependent dehydrogenase (short-subunit alcohol dehydrogenase family)